LVEFGAINIFILGCMNGLRIWFTRAGNFRALGGFQFSRSACVVAFQLLFSLVGRKALFLVGGQVIGLFVATAQLVAFADRSLFRALVARYQPASMWAMARRYSTFALYGAPQTFGRLMSQNIPALMLPVLFGPAQSGLFWLAYRMLILPGAIFVESTRSVFFLQASEVMKNGGDLRPVLIRPAVYLGLASAVVSLLLWAAGPAIFGLAFGAQWRESGHYAAIISIAWAFENISVSSSVIISLLELQKVYLTLEVISLALRAAALYAGYLLGSAEGAVGLYSGVSAIMVVAVIIYVQWILSRPERRIRDAA
jgi:O-antigen/teichoic acid export membrane protein